MSKTWKFIPGDWNLICDVCGTKVKASQSKRRWDGLIVCPKDFEFRHPQDFLRSKIDKIAVPFSRPQPVDQFVTINYVDAGNNDYTPNEDLRSAIAGVAIAGLAISGKGVSLSPNT